MAAVSAAVSAATAVLLTILTAFLLRDARLGRQAGLAATVIARPVLDPSNELYVVVYLDNLGPAVARDVDLTLGLRSGAAAAVDRALNVPVLAPGERHAYLPGLILDQEPTPTLETLDLRGYSLALTWEWTDSRRGLIRGKPTKHRDSLVVDLSRFRASFHDGPLVLLPGEGVGAAIRDLTRKLDEVRRREEMRSRPVPAEIQVRLDEHRLRSALRLWRLRVDRFILRRRG